MILIYIIIISSSSSSVCMIRVIAYDNTRLNEGGRRRTDAALPEPVRRRGR